MASGKKMDCEGKGIDRRTFLKTAGLTAAAVGASMLPSDNSIGNRIVPSAQAGEPGVYDSCRVVVFAADGLRFDYSQTLRGQEAPGLNALNPPICSSAGGLSSTQPGWASIWSALPSHKIKCYANREYKRMPRGYHIIEKLAEQYAGRDLYIGWITGKSTNIAGYKANRPTEKRRKKTPHHSVYELIVEQGHLGGYHGDEFRENSEVYALASGQLAEIITNDYDNFICFIHFHDPDHTGHTVVNEGNPNDYDLYMQKALEVDQMIYDLMLELPANTDVIYCSDHGFDFESQGDPKSEHKFSPHGMLATNFPVLNGADSSPVSNVSRMSIGRLIYMRAGGNPGYTKKKEGVFYRMYGDHLV